MMNIVDNLLLKRKETTRHTEREETNTEIGRERDRERGNEIFLKETRNI